MRKLLEHKKIVVPVILIAAMLLFIVISLAMRGVDSNVDDDSFIVETPDLPETNEPEMFRVHIIGAVENEGLIPIPRGSIVDDVIRAAGGAAEDACLRSVNLAAPVQDGQQIHVLREGQARPDDPTRERININLANATELQELRGVGPVVAERIVAFRDQIGGFNSVEELLNVRGIGESIFADIRDFIFVP